MTTTAATRSASNHAIGGRAAPWCVDSPTCQLPQSPMRTALAAACAFTVSSDRQSASNLVSSLLETIQGSVAEPAAPANPASKPH